MCTHHLEFQTISDSTDYLHMGTHTTCEHSAHTRCHRIADKSATFLLFGYTFVEMEERDKNTRVRTTEQSIQQSPQTLPMRTSAKRKQKPLETNREKTHTQTSNDPSTICHSETGWLYYVWFFVCARIRVATFPPIFVPIYCLSLCLSI